MANAAALDLAMASDSTQVDKVVEQLKTNRDDVSLTDLMSVAEHLTGSLHTIFSALDSTIFREFGSIASSITRARDEIDKLQPHDITKDHIPGADRELQAIITATEDATNTIMECSEAILEIEANDLESYKAAVSDNVMQIFEACSFQDITGQRVSKVVNVLEDIDDRVSRFATAFGTTNSDVAVSERERERDERAKDQILNGPALEGEGVDQNDIDQMLTEDQSGIDAMFD